MVTLEKMESLSNSQTERYNVIYEDEPKVQNKRLFHKRGVIVFLRDLFEEANIKFEAYWSSIKFFIKGEEFIIFQHTSKSGIEWFHFSDKFKGKSIKAFLKRVKKFLIEKIGNTIKAIFDKFMSVLDKYLGGLVEDVKKVVAKETKVPAQKKIFMAEDGTMHFKYFGLLRMAVKAGQSKITINVAKEFFDANRKKYMKAISEILEDLYEISAKDTLGRHLIIRKRPAWLIS